jgi:hypothetical protein
MEEPGTCVVTEFKYTGLKPAPKPPLAEEVVVPPKVRVPTPSVAETVPPCVPPAPVAALPEAAPEGVLTEPELPLVLVNSPEPDEVEDPASSVVVEDPLPLELPPLLAVPLT